MLPPESNSPPPASLRSTPVAPPDASEAPRLDTSLRVESMLLKEFDYAGLTAYQVYDNRERIFNFYFTLMGALLSGLGALYQISVNTHSDWRPLAAGLLIAGGFLSVIFFVRLIHLRQALRESMITSYVIKEFYIQQFVVEIPNIEQAFRWRLATIPSGERPSSQTSFVLYPIAALCAVSFGIGALLIAQLEIGSRGLAVGGLPATLQPWAVGALVGALVALMEWAFHHSQLSANKELKILEQQALKLGVTLGEAGQRQTKPLMQQLMPWWQDGTPPASK